MTSANAPDRKDRAVSDGQNRDGGARRSSQKSDAAFRTISEVATELDVPQHVLRFWETKFSQIRPMKRGGGRRYYRPEDVILLTTLRDLLYREGYTIKGVQKLLRENGVKALVQVVHERRERADSGDSVGPVGPALADGHASEKEDDGDDATAAPHGANPSVSPILDANATVGRADAADPQDGEVSAPPVGASADQGIATRSGTPGPAAGLTHAQRDAIEAVIAELTDLRRHLGAALAATAPPAPPDGV